MLKSIWQTIILVLIIITLVLVQNSFIGALSNSFRHFNFLLFVLIFILFFLDLRLALLSTFTASIFLDLISFNFFGLYMLVFFTTIIIAWYILKNWLTNRSLYTLLTLLAFAIIFYNFIAALAIYLAGENVTLSFLWRADFWLAIIYQITWSSIFALIMFNLAANVSKRIKPFFLENKSLYDDF